MATRSLNKVLLIGNLVRDPELRYTPNNTAVANFTIATNRTWTNNDGTEQESAEFTRCVAWGKLAEIVDSIFKKGRKVFVEGRLQTREWDDQEGNKQRRTEVVVDQVIALDSNFKGESSDQSNEDYSYPDKNSASDSSALEVDDKTSLKTKKTNKDIDELADDIPF